MLPSLATVEELEERIEVINVVRAQARLNSASALVRAYTGKSFVDDEGNLTAVPDIIKNIVLDAAERAMLNPGGMTYEQIGQYAARWASGSSTVFLTDQEVRLVVAAVGKTIRDLQMRVVELCHPDTVWVDVSDGSGPIPIDDA